MSNAQIIADEVAEWSNRNRVKLNIDKCKELRISFASVSRGFPPVVIGGECIKAVSDAKLLGVTISSDLSWNAHITEVIKKAAKRLYFLIQLKRARVSQKDLCLFYVTCVRSVIDYAVPVFHYSLPAYLKCYYDQKITFIFSSDFETMFIKHSPSEIISLNFEKKTVNLNCNFPV